MPPVVLDPDSRGISEVKTKIRRAANLCIGMPWEDNGVTDPSREDYVYHLEYNYIHDYGQGILSDFGAVHSGKFIL